MDLILTTKLYSPASQAGQPARPVARPRLVRQLEEGVRLGRRLSLVSAPAGFGKTSLVAEWLAESGRAHSWLSLDEGDNDPARFFRYLTAALQRAQAGLAPLPAFAALGERAASLAAGPQQPGLEMLLTLLINDLAEVPTAIVLVLDDYHLIQNAEIHQAIQMLVERAPTALHLALVTREDPPLALSRLRVRGQLTEIRVADLRFTPEEASAFLGASLGVDLPARLVAALDQRTEGWIAGLQLAALSLQGRDAADSQEFITAFNGSHHYVIDYLAEEVLRRQSGEVVDFLIQTSILERMCAELCNTIIENREQTFGENRQEGALRFSVLAEGRFSKAQSILDHLSRSNLFLIPLDERREWYRYHHLFADFLRNEASHRLGSELPRLHARAAAWFEAHGFLDEAIHHAHQAGDLDATARMIRAAAGGAVQRGELRSLVDWINLLPDEAVRQDANLATYLGWVLLLAEHVQEAEGYARSAEEALAKNVSAKSASAAERGRLAGLQAYLAVVAGDVPRTLALCQEAADLLAEDDPVFLSTVLTKLGYTQQQLGDFGGAEATLRRALEAARRAGSRMAWSIACGNLVGLLIPLGQRRAAEDLCRQGLAESTDAKGRVAPAAAFIDVGLGMALYYANQLDEAERCLERAVASSRQLGMSPVLVGGLNILALIHYARGDRAGAYARLDETIRQAGEIGIAAIERTAAGVRADLKLRDGDLAAAAAWLEQAALPLEPPDLLRQNEYYPAGRILARLGRFDEAGALVERLCTADQAHGCRGSLIVDWVLQADLHSVMGDSVRAVQALGKAVRTAAGEDYRRIFLDYGAAVLDLLGQVRGLAPAFVDDILEDGQGGRAEKGGHGEMGGHGEKGGHIGPPLRGEMAEPLSEREMDVLRLLAAGLSNREIADRLVLSEGTARWHVNNIFGKLGVHNRIQAAAAARKMKLIP